MHTCWNPIGTPFQNAYNIENIAVLARVSCVTVALCRFPQVITYTQKFFSGPPPTSAAIWAVRRCHTCMLGLHSICLLLSISSIVLFTCINFITLYALTSRPYVMLNRCWQKHNTRIVCFSFVHPVYSQHVYQHFVVRCDLASSALYRFARHFSP